MKSTDWQKRLKHIVVDEAHCVVTWGHDFRRSYAELGTLKSIFPQARVLAMTATATVGMQRDIIRCLGLRNCNLVSLSFDRPNIKYCVLKRPGWGQSSSVEQSYDFIFNPLIKELKDKRSDFKKTVIYTKLKWCGYGYEEAIRSDRCGETTDISQLVSQYHSPCTKKMRKTVLTNMGSPHGEIKLLFATEAYSMGTDVPDIRRIIHAGVPTSLETYIQEVGRAGRDGQPSEATMFFNSSDISTAVKGMTSEMRDYCNTTCCRRQFLCKHFGFDIQEVKGDPHTCCDICEQKCNCDNCVISRQLNEETLSLDDSNKEMGGPQIVDERQICIYNTLLQYFQAENDSLNFPVPHLVSGLTDEVAKTISLNWIVLQKKEQLVQRFPFINCVVLDNICLIMQYLISEKN